LVYYMYIQPLKTHAHLLLEIIIRRSLINLKAMMSGFRTIDDVNSTTDPSVDKGYGLHI